eukprot:CAMPEP_0197719518 /NCGR_PEP_ID=MMETSP1434-20131217/3241_1 /TAXON_ID=265543 /ORGANISM="Minutocellus polymorphus, Strain CCMP3303" /LENGTH=202 /DNA_ID=CAMNT_0043304271 /DNA_START=28 /DNA_END=636 /DNA_ORIENTATION=-
MKIFAAYLLVSIALASGTSEDASLRGSSDLDVNVERELKNACANSDVKYNTYSGKACFSRCACQACEERGGGVCCVASCNPQCNPDNPPCEDSQVHKYCYDKDLCKKCTKKGLCCTDVCDFHHCNKDLPPCEGPCFDNIDDCQAEVQCPLGCGTGCAQEGTALCHKCCRDKHPAFSASCEVDVRQSCKNECNQVYNTLSCSF